VQVALDLLGGYDAPGSAVGCATFGSVVFAGGAP